MFENSKKYHMRKMNISFQLIQMGRSPNVFFLFLVSTYCSLFPVVRTFISCFRRLTCSFLSRKKVDYFSFSLQIIFSSVNSTWNLFLTLNYHLYAISKKNVTCRSYFHTSVFWICNVWTNPLYILMTLCSILVTKILMGAPRKDILPLLLLTRIKYSDNTPSLLN